MVRSPLEAPVAGTRRSQVRRERGTHIYQALSVTVVARPLIFAGAFIATYHTDPGISDPSDLRWFIIVLGVPYLSLHLTLWRWGPATMIWMPLLDVLAIGAFLIAFPAGQAVAMLATVIVVVVTVPMVGRGPSILLALAMALLVAVAGRDLGPAHGVGAVATWVWTVVLIQVILMIDAIIGDVRSEGDEQAEATIATFAHEARTPLTSISGYAKTLRQRFGQLDEDQVLDALARMESNAVRLAETADQILTLARAEHARMDGVPLDLAQAIPAAIEESDLGSTGGTINVNVPDKVVVRGDRAAFTLIMRNLLENARRYAGTDQPLEIDVTPGRGHAWVHVRDHGPGIPAEAVERVTLPFQRGSDVADGGVGIGLALVRALVERSGGALSIGEAKGGGALISFSLPLAGAPTDTDREQAPPSLVTQGLHPGYGPAMLRRYRSRHRRGSGFRSGALRP